MYIAPGVRIIDRALYCKNALVMADIHIGYEEMLNKKGYLIPRLQFEDMVKRLESIFDSLENKKVGKIIINGDLKHEFGTISEQEWRNTLKFIDILTKHCEEIVLVKGNHDAILGPIARKRNVKIVDYYLIDYNTDEYNNERYNNKIPITKKINKNKPKKILVIHGNRIPEKEVLEQAGTIIIGHEHPAVSLREGVRVEQFKCFLKGRFKGKNLIVLPSFNTLVEGTDVLRDDILSPFLKGNLDDFEVYIVEDKVYEFGKLGKLRNH